MEHLMSLREKWHDMRDPMATMGGLLYSWKYDGRVHQSFKFYSFALFVSNMMESLDEETMKNDVIKR